MYVKVRAWCLLRPLPNGPTPGSRRSRFDECVCNGIVLCQREQCGFVRPLVGCRRPAWCREQGGRQTVRTSRSSAFQWRVLAVTTTSKAYDDPGNPEEISRRQFMAGATVVLGGVVGLGVAIPTIAALVPTE